MPAAPPAAGIYDDEPPSKNPEKYSTTITERVKLQKMLTQEFFKENVERARARNERWAISVGQIRIFQLILSQSKGARRDHGQD